MGDELIARSAQLVGMPIAGEIKGTRQGGAVNRRDRGRGPATVGSGVVLRRRVKLLDHGEEVG